MEKNTETSDDQRLLAEIERHCAAEGVKESTFGIYATGNSRLVPRLRERIRKGREEAEAIRRYMRENPPGSRSRASGPTAP